MLPPSAIAGRVVSASASASTRRAQRNDFMSKTPPTEVVNGLQAAMKWRASCERYRNFCNSNRTQDHKKALRLSLRSRKRPIDGHLAGLLTYASMNLKRLPGYLSHSRQNRMETSQWHVAQVLSAYSCGAVADSHRASHYQMERSYRREKEEGQEIAEISNFKFEFIRLTFHSPLGCHA